MMNQPFQSFLSQFYESAKGQILLQQEKNLIARSLSQVFGLYLVQLGSPSRETLLDSSRVNYKVVVSQNKGDVHPASDVQASLDYLPFRKDSIDVVVMPHTLEAVNDPYHLIRQADEMLIAEGHLLVTGFNPIGCKILLNYLGQQRSHFKHANMIRDHRVIDWLHVLGYDIKEVSYSPVSCLLREGKRQWRLTQFLGKFLRLCGIHFGNSYCILAKKRVSSPTPVGLNWRVSNWLPVRKSRPIVTNRSKINLKSK